MSQSEPEFPTGKPAIEVFDHCESAGDTAGWLERHSESALRLCLQSPGSRCERLLSGLDAIEVSLVSDASIAAVHGQFMDDPTPTDVITFQHGEILISLETAARQAAEHGHPSEREALLYLIHGLLHLNGFDDTTAEARAEMEAVQVEILQEISPFPGSGNPR